MHIDQTVLSAYSLNISIYFCHEFWNRYQAMDNRFINDEQLYNWSSTSISVFVALYMYIKFCPIFFFYKNITSYILNQFLCSLEYNYFIRPVFKTFWVNLPSTYTLFKIWTPTMKGLAPSSSIIKNHRWFPSTKCKKHDLWLVKSNEWT